MATSGSAVAEAAVATPEELIKKLQRLVSKITVGEDGRLETYDEAERVLAALKGRQCGGSGSSNQTLPSQRKEEGKISTPEYFLCPISGDLMRDPVILASGQTYDRPFIQEWLCSGNRICPQSQHVLSNTILIPNNLVRSMISEWCTDNDVTLPPFNYDQEQELITRKERNALTKISDSLSLPSSITEKKQAFKELRQLTKRNRSFRALLGANPDTIQQLLSVLSVAELNCDPELQEDAVTTILNLSILDSNKEIVGDNPHAINLLIEALKTGSMESRRNSAAALFSLSALDSNKLKIGELGAIKLLVELLEQGSHSAKKDAGSAIFNLCKVHENRARAVSARVVGVVLKAIVSQPLVDESLAILALLSSNQEAIDEIAKNGGVPSMLSIIRDDSSCGRNKENAAVVLFLICMHDQTKLREVEEEEKLNASISRLAESGTSRARRKASGILDQVRKTLCSTQASCSQTTKEVQTM